MSRLSPRDWIVLGILFPVFAVLMVLHVREIQRSGLAQPPVFAVAGSEDAYPLVGGRRLERGLSWNGLEVGDKLVRVGDADLAGAGYLTFDAIALEQAGDALAAPLVFERDGVRQQVELRMLPYAQPWLRAPFMVLLIAIALMALLRSPRGSPAAFWFATGATLVAIFETPISSASATQTLVGAVLFNFGGSAAIAAMLMAAIRFPDEMPEASRLSPAWAVLGLLHVATRLFYMLPSPIPSDRVPSLALTSDAILALSLLAILTWNFRHATPVGRRRLKWMLYGMWLAGSSLLAATLLVPWLGALGVGVTFADALPFVFAISFVGVGLGCSMAMGRFQLLDVDRFFTPTASYSLLVMGALGLLLVLAPRIADATAALTGAPAELAHVGLAALLAATLVPVQKRVRPLIDRVFFPERLTLEEDFDRLLRDLRFCESEGEVLELAEERLHTLLRPEHCRVYRQSDACFAARASRAGRALPTFDAEGALVRRLESRPLPLRIDSELPRSVPDLAREELEALGELRASLLLPVRTGNRLTAFIAIGPRLSGDVFTAPDLTLLRAVGEKASDELLRLESAANLAHERERASELADLKRQADEANAAKSRFLAAASHDLRQPLHALGLFVEGLGERVQDPATAEIVAKIQTSTEALSEMFEDLLDMSRLDAGVIEPSPEDLELSALFARLRAEAEGAAADKGLALRVELTDERVHSDPILLSRIVQNLLTNAIRYTESGHVALRAVGKPDGVEIEIQDTGPGIAPERQREIFQEFVRLGAGGSGDPDGGLGLGLSIVKRLCGLLDHGLELESEPGRGSVFRVRVARAQRSAVRPTPRGRGAAGANLSGRRVLVVDDSLPILQGMRQVLEGWGCKVAVAASLEDALEGLSRSGESPDAIVSDYHLGEHTGFDVVAAVREHAGRPIPAVLVSGDTTPERLRAFEAQGFPHLSKPVMPFKLRAALSELLRD